MIIGRGKRSVEEHFGRIVGHEPFAVVLGKTILEPHSGKPVIRRLIDVYEELEEAVLALEMTTPAKGGEIQLTDALREWLKDLSGEL